ncbi:MAG: Rrf2 family transcriptional regulator [Proteobacteria bacterium]|nr:Rrf2 family transcriptional regulator [Pseudomonadota bacterium]
MQLTRFTDYCLRVLMYLSCKRDGLTTIAELARNYRISSNHLMKVVHRLGLAGYIETVRGRGGGMRLAREPEQINLAEVVEHCEESIAVLDCLAAGYAGDCPLMPRCALRNVLRGAQRAFLDHLATFSLQDLVQSRQMQQAILPPAARPRAPSRRAARGGK